MSEINWVDVTSYRRGEDRIPSVWEIRYGCLRIVVTRHIRRPGRWVLDCKPWFDHHELASSDMEGAKLGALGLVIAALRESYDAMNNVYRICHYR